MGRRPKWPMSAYSASAPVSASTMAPTAASTCQPRSARNSTARNGCSAARMAGCSMICQMPVTASVPNHSTMTGPNILPTTPVPKRCTRNNATSTSSASGTTQACRPGAMTTSPSIAPSTEMAGVMRLSP